MIESKLLTIRIFLVKVTQKTGQEKKLLSICYQNLLSVLKTDPWTLKLKV